jgi:hypothetical protein
MGGILFHGQVVVIGNPDDFFWSIDDLRVKLKKSGSA